MNWDRTEHLIPDGVQTLSKMPSKHIDGVYPKYLDRGKGACVWAGDKEYIDYPCGLGTNLLGYAYPSVVEAVAEAVRNGHLLSLPHKKETELAELVTDMIPSAEMVRFLKTGSEATSAAVKIARAYTGREAVVCVGYHGWHDWYSFTTEKNLGVPKQKVRQVPYGDFEAIKTAFPNPKIAAVIMEPYIYSVDTQYLKKVRRYCDAQKAVLIFDEVVTGFRTLKYSAQAYYDVMPDLTCLGKAMANGVPISCVCGKRDLMNVLTEDCFVSSTYGGDLIGINAAIATLTELKTRTVMQHIWNIGERFQSHFNMISRAEGYGDQITCLGMPPRSYFKFPAPEHKSLFWQECLKKGVLFGHAQFISYSHNVPELDKTIIAMRHGMKMVRKYYEAPEKALEGNVATETLRRS